MDEMRIACYGVKGHQILGAIPRLERARLVAIGGVTDEEYAVVPERHPELLDGVPRRDQFGAILNEDRPGLVSICSSCRADQTAETTAALEAGVNLLAEKPLAVDGDGGTPALMRPEDGLRTTEVALCARQSADEGRPVRP